MTEDEPDLPRGIALAWGVAADPQRGPKREMSVERIVEAAVELADAEGIGAVSMAAVASRLGFTPMSLYRYVSAKDDLLLLMQEEAVGLPPEPASEGRAEPAWRSRLGQLYRAQVAAYVAHPWVLAVPIQGSPITPNSSAWLDEALQALEQTALSHEERVAVALLIAAQSRFCGMVLAGYADRMRTSGQSPAEVTAEEARLYDALIAGDEFPALRAAVDAGVFVSDGDPFAFGLERCLDGVAAYIAAREGGVEGEELVPWDSQSDAALLADRRYREAQKAVRVAQKALRDARRSERQIRREALERLARAAKDG